MWGGWCRVYIGTCWHVRMPREQRWGRLRMLRVAGRSTRWGGSVRDNLCTVHPSGGVGRVTAGDGRQVLGVPIVPEPFDEVITVCDSANESCPVFPGARSRRHWSIDDPSGVTGSEEERLTAVRRARDAVRQRIETELLGA